MFLMEKEQIEKVVEKATRKILNGGVNDDFLFQCLSLVCYLEEHNAEDERADNPDPNDYKEIQCQFFA